MKIRTTQAYLAIAAIPAVLILVLSACSDKTQAPENQALTQKRQEIIAKHKQDP